jgi:integrase/recombinase XerD
MSEPRASRRRKPPKNCEWRGATLHGRIRIKGTLKRWSLRTGDVEIARARVAEDIKRLKAAAFYGDHRVRYRDIVASWAERHIIHEVGERTAERYAVSLRQLERFLLDLFLDEVNAKEKIEEIVMARRADGVSTATIRRDLTALSSVLVYADIPDNAALARLKRLKERRDPIELPEGAHIERVIARAPGAFATLIAVAWRTGCRLDELVHAERSRLDHARRQLTVIGKGNKLRVIDLDFGGAYALIRAMPASIRSRWLFWHGDGRRYRNLSSRFAALCRDVLATAEKESVKTGRAEPDFRVFRFHDLRHRHAVDWLKAGRSIYDLQQRLGHASIKTTEIYLSFLTPEEARAAKFGAPVVTEQRGA